MIEKKKKEERINFRLEAELAKKLDILRASETDVPTRPEMIRRLIARAQPLKAQG